jgi:methylated-DNA-[protein]-cysteine S-methyltransferase
MKLVSGTYESPIGTIHFTLQGGAIAALGFHERFARGERADDGDTRALVARLDRYFAGDLAAFDGARVAARGTAFQERVWSALRAIQPGETRSYAELAAAIGAPSAVRAVGAANGKNPVSLIVPCHRVIGKDGTLTGYAGGLDRKRWLLAHEGVRG